MKTLKNKKGFTLIEMLVVIAIIAVLAAIIIPTVTKSTTKAQAAADAANMRSILAEANTDYLGGVTETDGYVHFTAGTSTTDPSFTVVGAPASKMDKSYTYDITLTNGTLGITLGGFEIKAFTDVADGTESVLK